MPNYEDFKKYGEMEKQKKAGHETSPHPQDQPRQSWLSRTLSGFRAKPK